MTFNVENLFDTQNDYGKNDETYLPKKLKSNPYHLQKCKSIKVKKWRDECLNLDWNKEILRQKLDRVAAVIRSVNEGRGADLVVLQEVENYRVLSDLLRSGGLNSLGYQAVLIEGRDIRGIDIAILTRLKLIDSKLHEIPFKKLGKSKGDTRGILQLRLSAPGGGIFSVFGVHFPAPFHPTRLRKEAIAFLSELAKSESAKGHIVIAAGDFNVTSKEEREQKILEPFKSEWLIAHHIGCQKCRGTTYYAKDKTWSFLDQIWVYKPHQKWELVPDSVRVLNSLAEQVDTARNGAPKAFKVSEDGKTSSGVSDHWPLYLELRRVADNDNYVN
jgi:endonuclease/exonuclease/phosphatase family metal-dependent hydrolase